MKWLYLIAGLGFLVKMLWLSPAQTEAIWEATVPIAQEIGSAGGVPNAVSAIIFRNRLYPIFRTNLEIIKIDSKIVTEQL